MRRIRIKGVNDMKEYAFGIDLGGTTAKVGLFTTSGKLLEKWEVSTDTSNNGAHILENLAAAVQQKMQEKGLTVERMWDGSMETLPVSATDMEHYRERPDVIFVCVKGYSLAGTIPFIKKAAKKDTVVIPVLNIYGTGAKMQKELPEYWLRVAKAMSV